MLGKNKKWNLKKENEEICHFWSNIQSKAINLIFKEKIKEEIYVAYCVFPFNFTCWIDFNLIWFAVYIIINYVY